MIVLKWLLKITKYLLIITSSLLVGTVLAVSLLLFTHSGNQAVISIVKKFESRLTIELVKGALFDMPQFENIRWQDGETLIDIKRADYTFDWSCLTDKLCLTQLNVEGVQILLPETKEVGEEEITEADTPPFKIDIPIEFIVGDLTISNLNFAMGQLTVALDKITLQADAFQKDVNLASQIMGLLITLPDSEQQVITKVVTNKSTSKQKLDLNIQSIPALLTAEMLPVVSLPINLTVKPIKINNVKIMQNNANLFELNSLDSAFTFIDTSLNIEKFNLDIPETNLSINGNIDFINDYPLDLSLNGTVKHIKQLQPHTLLADVKYNFNSVGSLSDLNSQLTLSNKISLHLNSHLNLFADNLPHKINLSWQNLQWPLTGIAQYKAEKGHFNSQGSLLDYKLALLGDYSLKGAPAGIVSLNTNGGLQHLQIEQLKVETLSGNFDFSGVLAWKDKVDWLGQLSINNIDLTALDTEYDGIFSGNIQQQVSVTLYENHQPDWQFDFPVLHIDGDLLSRPFNVSGRVSGDQKQGILFDKLAVINEDNNLLIDGRLAENNDLSITLDIADISHLMLGAKGMVSGHVYVKGPNDELRIKSKLAAQTIAYEAYAIETVNLDGALILTDKPQIDVVLKAQSIDAAGQHIDDIALQVSNQKFDSESYRHQIELLAKSELISTDLNIYLTQTDEHLLVEMDSAKIHLPYQVLNLSDPINVISRANNIGISAHCWAVTNDKQRNAGKLCVKEANVGESGNIAVDIDRYLLTNLTPFLPEQFNMNGAVSATADMQWQKEANPIFDIALFSEDMILNINTDPSTQNFESYEMESFEISLQGKPQEVSVNAAVFSPKLIDVKLNAKLLPYQTHQTIDAQVSSHIPDFTPFLTLIPSLEHLAGQLDSNFTVTGDIKKPTINGNVSIQNGQISSADLPMKISELTALVEVKDSTARLTGSFDSSDTNTIGEKVAAVPLLTNTLNIFDQSVKKVSSKMIDNNSDKKEIAEVAKASPGVAYINGQFDWSKKFTGDVHFYAHKLEVYDYGKIDLLISPDIHLAVNEHIKIIGNLFIDKGKIVVKELPAGAVSQSSDIVVIDVERDTVDANLPVIINLGVNMGNDFQIIALGLDTYINGELLIEKPLEKDLSINGVLQLSDGSYTALGQQLTLQESRIIFQGAPDSPYLQIEAIRDPSKIEDDVTAGVRVTGTVDALELVIFSEPAMAQQEALSYLTRGQGLNSSSDSSTMANMLIDIAAGQSEGLMSTIGEEIGIKDLSLSSSGTGDDQSVGIRGEIAPGVEISYGVGVFDTFSILSLRYEVLERLYIEASSGIYQAVDAYYEWDWD